MEVGPAEALYLACRELGVKGEKRLFEHVYRERSLSCKERDDALSRYCANGELSEPVRSWVIARIGCMVRSV